MRRNCCHTSLAFILKFLNFFQSFLGICIIVYSFYTLNEFHHRIPAPPSPSPDPSPSPALLVNLQNSKFARESIAFNYLVSGLDDELGLNGIKLPAPWFIYSFMGVGIVICCITFIGYVAAETINGCCLCFYTLLKTVLILLEASFVAFVAFDHHWEKDLPFDPTGELDSLRSFIEHNLDICKWVGISVLIIQALSLLLAFILRAMVSTRGADADEDSYDIEGRPWEPLLDPQPSQASGLVKGDSRGNYSNIWSSRISGKYGLNNSEAKYSLLNPNSSTDAKSK